MQTVWWKWRSQFVERWKMSHSLKIQPSATSRKPLKEGKAKAKAHDKWLESKEGKQCMESGILFSPHHRQFLENRLMLAFEAGANWAEGQPKTKPLVRSGELLNGPPELYLVDTDRHEPKKAGAKIIPTEYRVLARSVIEAAEIVNESNKGTDEIVRSVRFASHVTQMATNRYKIVAV